MKRKFKTYYPVEFKDVFDFLDRTRDRVVIDGEKHAVRALYPKERINGVVLTDWAVGVFDTGDKGSRVLEVLTLAEFRTKFISGHPNGASTSGRNPEPALTGG